MPPALPLTVELEKHYNHNDIDKHTVWDGVVFVNDGVYLLAQTLLFMNQISRLAMQLKTDVFRLQPPSLQDIAAAVRPALQRNYASATVAVVDCPDLRNPPFRLASVGLCGNTFIADIGGQPNLFPRPLLDKKYSLLNIASPELGEGGMLLGAGAGPFHVVGQNCELALNMSWTSDGGVTNLTRHAEILRTRDGQRVGCNKTNSEECALMCNIFASEGRAGPVLKITARSRTGPFASITDVLRFAIRDHYGEETCISLGGVFVIRRGKANFHVMPDFPTEEKLPFTSPKVLNDWLTYHDFVVNEDGGDESAITCLSVFHSADPGKKMGLRMEHTHCFTTDGSGHGGHYHGDVEGVEVEYEGYFQVAEAILRVDRPEVTLERDLHD